MRHEAALVSVYDCRMTCAAIIKMKINEVEIIYKNEIYFYYELNISQCVKC